MTPRPAQQTGALLSPGRRGPNDGAAASGAMAVPGAVSIQEVDMAKRETIEWLGRRWAGKPCQQHGGVIYYMRGKVELCVDENDDGVTFVHVASPPGAALEDQLVRIDAKGATKRAALSALARRCRSFARFVGEG